MKKKIKKNIDAILELIEDKHYPARRVIYDYVVLLVGEFDYELSKEVDKYGEEKFNTPTQ